jgi:hypothetical protein
MAGTRAVNRQLEITFTEVLSTRATSRTVQSEID